MKLHESQTGFTIIELLVVCLFIGLLATVVGVTFTDIQKKRRDTERKSDITILQNHAEKYFVSKSKYPSFTDFSNSSWRTSNMKGLVEDIAKDPNWNSSSKCKDYAGKATLSSTSAGNCYTYDVKAADDTACDNVTKDCTKYALTASLETNEIYQINNLN